MEDSGGIAIDPWELARDRYLEDLSGDEKALFANATIENIFYGASAAQKVHEADSKTRLAARKLKPLVEALNQYGRALDIYSNASPTIMCPLWGSLRVLLQLAGAFEKYFAKLVDMFSRIGDVLPQFQAYKQLFPNHQRLLQVMSIAYLDIVKFCVEAKGVFRDRNKLRGIRIAWKGVWKTFDSKFDDSLAEFRVHKENVEKEAMLSHMIEAGKARDLELRDRALVETRRKEESRRRLLAQLSSVDADYKHRKLRQLRHEGTGHWIKNIIAFKRWMEATGSACLFCHGIPGSGKTVLSSSVADSIAAGINNTELAVAYYYCDYSDPNSLTAPSILGTLIKQLLATVEIPQVLEVDIDRCYGHGTRTPDNEEIFAILLATLKLFARVCLIIDGLDECSLEERALVLSSVKKLATSEMPVVKLFVSSRGEADITTCLKGFQQVNITKEGISKDITLFVTAAVDHKLRSGAMVVRNQLLRDEIITALVDGARGMFLWVFFQLEDLCEATSDREIRDTLRNLPRNLAETYSKILRKITHTRRNEEKLKKIHQAFRWVVCARRPLKVDELAEAIAVEMTDTSWDSEKMSIDGIRLIRQCGNLLVFDEDDRTVRLAHHTVQQFLLSNPVDATLASFHLVLPQAEVELGGVCITYLRFSDFETQVTRREAPLSINKTQLQSLAVSQTPYARKIVEGVTETLKYIRGYGTTSNGPVLDLKKRFNCSPPSQTMRAKYLFLDYAIENWLCHTKNLSRENESLWKLFQNLALEKQALFEFRPWANTELPEDFPFTPPFHWAIDAGHGALLRLLPGGAKALRSYLTFQEYSRLLSVALKGDAAVFETLCLASGLDLRGVPTHNLDLRAVPTHKVVSNAAAQGNDRLLKVLGRLGADLSVKVPGCEPPLFSAYRGKHESSFKLLLRYGADPDEIDTGVLGTGQTDNRRRSFHLLYETARTGHVELVEALLAAGASVDAISGDALTKTSLQAAVAEGHIKVVELLLAAKADVNFSPASSFTPLEQAVLNGRLDMVKLLLSAPTLELNMVGRSAVTTALRINTWNRAMNKERSVTEDEILMTLLEAGADVADEEEGGLILWKSVKTGQLQQLDMVLATKAFAGTIAPYSRGALVLAATSGHIEMLSRLLAAGAAVDAWSIEAPQTALHAAARGGHLEAVEVILAAEANVNTGRNVEYSSLAEPPLQAAVRGGNSLIVKRLLDAGADVNAENIPGCTGLEMAIEKSDPTLVGILLHAGADVNYVTSGSYGAPPLYLAASKEGRHAVEVIELLLAAGANVNWRDGFGVTALTQAMSYRSGAVAIVLRKAGAVDWSSA